MFLCFSNSWRLKRGIGHLPDNWLKDKRFQYFFVLCPKAFHLLDNCLQISDCGVVFADLKEDLNFKVIINPHFLAILRNGNVPGIDGDLLSQVRRAVLIGDKEAGGWQDLFETMAFLFEKC
jgi:hypothetical protein